MVIFTGSFISLLEAATIIGSSGGLLLVSLPWRYNPEMVEIRTKILTAGDRTLARKLFAMMAEVFTEKREDLSDAYLDRLLSRHDFWAIAALAGDDIIGGLTAYTLPMTRTESSEIFIYDLAVREDQRRKGVGSQLMTVLHKAAAAVGIQEVFVAVDNDDAHALDFYRSLGGKPSPVTFFTFPHTGR